MAPVEPNPGSQARDPFTHYQGPGWRQRLRIAVLAVIVALGILWSVLERPGAVLPPKSPSPSSPPDVAACAPGQPQQGCVGSMTAVIPAGASQPR